MKTIKVTSALTTGLDPALASAKSIEIEEQELGKGAFGVAHCAGRIDGKQVTPQVVKLLLENGTGMARQGFETVRELQSRLAVENRNASGTLLQKYPGLQGVPQLSFEGRLDGRPVLGYMANDLTKMGFAEFGKVFEDDVEFTAFLSVPLAPKLRMASELVSAFDFLSSHVRFIHADIKADALFIDVKQSHCAIIDFDSGALARKVSDSPSTFGTRQDWLAPEITRQLGGNASGRIHVNLPSDVWSVNVAIHYLIFGLHPLFFLFEISDRSMNAYLGAYRWPNVEATFPYFNKGLARQYETYIDFASKAIQPSIMKRFAVTIDEGFRDPAKRSSYGQWKSELRVASPAVIRQFTADRLMVTDSRPVHLTWDVAGAARLELDGADVTGRTSKDVAVADDRVFELTLIHANGTKITRQLAIRVDKTPPVILSFAADPPLLKTSKTARLAWSVTGAARLQIDNGVGDVTLPAFADVEPRTTTLYTLTATSFFGVSTKATVEVGVWDQPPAIKDFRADASLLKEGQPVVLDWDVSADAVGVTISGIGSVPPRGRRTIDLRRSETFVLEAVGLFGQQARKTVRVRVSQEPPVIQELRASPLMLFAGSDVALRWNVGGAERVRLDPQGENIPLSGNRTIHPQKTTRYVLHAESWYGVITEAHVTVTVVTQTTLAHVKRTSLADVPRTRLDGVKLTRLPRR